MTHCIHGLEPPFCDIRPPQHLPEHAHEDSSWTDGRTLTFVSKSSQKITIFCVSPAVGWRGRCIDAKRKELRPNWRLTDSMVWGQQTSGV